MDDPQPDRIDLFLSARSNSEIRAWLKAKMQDDEIIKGVASRVLHEDKTDEISNSVQIVRDLVSEIEFLRSQSIN